MRCGEALGLHWKNIDFVNNTITVERSRDFAGTHSPKTENSYRTILVAKAVMKPLETYQKWCKSYYFLDGGKLKDENDDAFVSLSELSADLVSPSAVAKSISRVIKRTQLPRITLHGLHDTHGTVLLNYRLKVIVERLGNTTDMIYKIYGHVLKEMEQESVLIFSQSLNSHGAINGTTGANSGASF